MASSYKFVSMHKILELYNSINQFGKVQNMNFEVVEPGKIIYTLTVREEHMATPLAIHGGVLAAMMDGVLGVTALSISCEEEKLVSTIEFKINFFQPAKLGDQLVGTGTVESKGKRIIITSGEIKAENRGVVVAKGIGTFNAYPLEKSGILEAMKQKT